MSKLGNPCYFHFNAKDGKIKSFSASLSLALGTNKSCVFAIIIITLMCLVLFYSTQLEAYSGNKLNPQLLLVLRYMRLEQDKSAACLLNYSLCLKASSA